MKKSMVLGVLILISFCVSKNSFAEEDVFERTSFILM